MLKAIEGAAVEGLEEALQAQKDVPYVLRLYVSGLTRLSLHAIANTKRICEAHLAGRYDLRIVDVHQDPQAARAFPVIAAPTLVKEAPFPARILVGDMSHTEAVLAGLGLHPAEGGS